MFRSLFTVLAVLALIASVSASSSSSSALPSKLSSSSSYLPANASTGASYSFMTSSSSSSGFPTGTYSVSFEVDFAYQITVANINATAQTVQRDIVYNLAQLSGFSNDSLASSVVVTSVNGTSTGAIGSSSRRLLQAAAYKGGVTFILLGSIVNSLPSLNPSTVVTAFVTAAAHGNLVAVYTNATIPTQTIQAAAIGPLPSSSSTGYGQSGAVSAASAGAALLFAAVASLALLL